MKGHAHRCHCGISRHIAKLRASKLGVFGCTLIVLHLLWHVAECLVLPAVFIALNRHDAEAAEFVETTLDVVDSVPTSSRELDSLRLDFRNSLDIHYPCSNAL